MRPGHQLGDPAQATKTALRRLARRHQHLSEEIGEADHELAQLVGEVAPELLALPGVGPEVAGQLLTSAGDNPDRITSEAAFAHLCGVAPIPASSGRAHRHRLNRGGDRQANNALYIVVLNRLRHDPRSRAYAERRTQEGLSKPEIIRCLKRYVAREIYHVLITRNRCGKPGQPSHLTMHRSIGRLLRASRTTVGHCVRPAVPYAACASSRKSTSNAGHWGAPLPATVSAKGSTSATAKRWLSARLAARQLAYVCPLTSQAADLLETETSGRPLSACIEDLRHADGHREQSTSLAWKPLEPNDLLLRSHYERHAAVVSGITALSMVIVCGAVIVSVGSPA